jgi:hypothetical protein
MQNPFETGHIKNYLLLYASVVVIMILFFIASTLFNEVDVMQVKVFDTNGSKIENKKEIKEDGTEENVTKFKLLDKAY